MELLQIVPMLPPTLSGVGDFALLLAHELRTHHGVQTRFLNADIAWRDNGEHVAPFAADVVEERSAAALQRALERADSCRAVLLHYVGHGYEKRGCPFWLVRALEQWKPRSRARLVVLFHEVSGTGPIWTSGFWTAGAQTALAKRLAHLGDFLRITTEVAAKRVRAMLPAGSRTPIRILPVFSTLGEPAALLPHEERSRQLVVFGGAGWRRDAYTRHLPTLQRVCRELHIENVIDLGASIDTQPTLDVPFIKAGPLPAQEAGDLMRTSAVGFFTYPVPYIGKSTIFAAYCAHGLLPVTFAENAVPGDATLEPGEHFLAGLNEELLSTNRRSEIAQNARHWYQQHRLAIHAQEIADTIFKDA